MRRWKRLKLIAKCFVEFNGKPVASVKKGFRSGVRLAGSAGKVSPHTFAPHGYNVADAARSAHLGGRWFSRDVGRGPAKEIRTSSPRLYAGCSLRERWLALRLLGKKGKKPNEILLGVAGFEPATLRPERK
jgi:hypothetical protein